MLDLSALAQKDVVAKVKIWPSTSGLLQHTPVAVGGGTPAFGLFPCRITNTATSTISLACRDH